MDGSTGPEDVVYIRLTADEALVLFEWVHRNEDADLELGSAGVTDPAERQVLWGLSAVLEKLLVEPFRANYLELVEEARAHLRPPADEL